MWRGVFVIVPCGVPRAITMWTWVLRRGSRTQNSTESLKSGPSASGASSKNIREPRFWSPSKVKPRTKKAYQGAIANKKLKEQLLGRATHCPSARSDLKQNNLNKKLPEHVFSMFLLTSATRPVINNKLVQTKKRVDLVGESQPQWDMHEGKTCLGLLWS